MSWSYSTKPSTKEATIARLLSDGPSGHTLKDKAVVGNEIWTLWADPSGVCLIVLYLLACKDKCWGHASFTEACFPYYFKCPKAFLSLATVTCPEWRALVEAYHVQANARRGLFKNLTLGSIVTLKGCKPEVYQVTALTPLQGRALNDGRVYRLPKTRITEVAAPTPVEAL